MHDEKRTESIARGVWLSYQDLGETSAHGWYVQIDQPSISFGPYSHINDARHVAHAWTQYGMAQLTKYLGQFTGNRDEHYQKLREWWIANKPVGLYPSFVPSK